MAEKFKLKYPFGFEGKKINEVSWRRLKGKDMMQSEREAKAKGLEDMGNMERTLYLIARATNQPIEVIEEMDAADVVTLSAKAQDFL